MESLLPAQSGEVLPNSDLLLQNDGIPTSRTPVTTFINIYFLSGTAMRFGGASSLLVGRDLQARPFGSLAGCPSACPPPHHHPTHHGLCHVIPPPGHLGTDLCLLSRASDLLAWWLMIAHRSVGPLQEHIPV